MDKGAGAPRHGAVRNGSQHGIGASRPVFRSHEEQERAFIKALGSVRVRSV